MNSADLAVVRRKIFSLALLIKCGSNGSYDRILINLSLPIFSAIIEDVRQAK